MQQYTQACMHQHTLSHSLQSDNTQVAVLKEQKPNINKNKYSTYPGLAKIQPDILS